MWVLLYRDGSTRKYATLGLHSKMNKSQAEAKRDELLSEVNARNAATPDPDITFGEFLEGIALPFLRSKWKRSTAATTENRITHHLGREFGEKRLSSLSLKDLQSFLTAKAETLSRSVVAHLRWDLRAIFKLALAEGYAERDPTGALFTPKQVQTSEARVMTKEEVEHYITALEPRERVIAHLALFAGMRPGEILALQRRHVSGDCRRVRIEQPLPGRHRQPQDELLHPHRRCSTQDRQAAKGVDGVGGHAARGMGIRVRECRNPHVEGQRMVSAHEAQVRAHRAGVGHVSGAEANARQSRPRCRDRSQGSSRPAWAWHRRSD